MTSELFRESPFEVQSGLLESLSRLRNSNANDLPRRRLYAGVLSQLRMLFISRMAKPEEVIVVVNDNNEAIRELGKYRFLGFIRLLELGIIQCFYLIDVFIMGKHAFYK